MAGRSTSASSPTRRATPSRRPPRSRARAISARSTVRARAAATSWPWPATGSSWPTMARPPWPCPGGLTRLVDKRKVRRDRADFFCTLEEGIKGQRAVEWRLVDEVVPRSKLAEITVQGPAAPPPASLEAIHAAGAQFWPLRVARELDDLFLHLRANEEEIGIWVFKTQGSVELVEAHDRVLQDHAADWLVREIRLYLKRTLKRLDVSSRSIFALIEPGSCFTGTLLELALAADRSYMLDGAREGGAEKPATLRLTGMNFGAYPMVNGLSRLASRVIDEPGRVDELMRRIGEDRDARAAGEAGLVTFTPDDIDWEDEVRVGIEARAAFSPDALTGMEASLRFGGPETMESKIFSRLSAWQNWIFQRPNAVGDKGALRVYGTGQRSEFDRRRV